MPGTVFSGRSFPTTRRSDRAAILAAHGRSYRITLLSDEESHPIEFQGYVEDPGGLVRESRSASIPRRRRAAAGGGKRR